MKKSLPFIPVFLCTLVLFNSCATSKDSISERKTEIGNSKEENTTCFVQMKNGSIRNFTSLVLVTGVLMTPHLLGDNGIKIYPNEIKAYQNKDHYALSQVGFASGRRSFVAEETLPGFAIRIARGKLNIYCKKYINGASSADEYFLQLGNDGKVFTYTPALMNEFVKDNPEAADFFNSKKHKDPLSKRLQATAAIINNSPLISKN